MHTRRARASVPSISADGTPPTVWSAMTRRMVLTGLAALTTSSLVSHVRADDMSGEMILNDPAAPVSGNANGDVTVVSFFDYNCPFCKSTVEPLKAVLASDDKLRHVYKDWPILAQSSVYGAKLALAAKFQNRYDDAYNALMAIEGSRVPEQRMREALARVGFDMTQLESEANRRDGEITTLLQRNNTQAEGLGLRGTPVFLIGQFLVASALDENGFRQVIADAREAS